MQNNVRFFCKHSVTGIGENDELAKLIALVAASKATATDAIFLVD